MILYTEIAAYMNIPNQVIILTIEWFFTLLGGFGFAYIVVGMNNCVRLIALNFLKSLLLMYPYLAIKSK